MALLRYDDNTVLEGKGMNNENHCKSRNSVTVTFKVDEELANLLKALPNRSEFIREAIMSRMAVPCPACGGSGRLSKRQALDVKALLETHYVGRCLNCGTRVTYTACARAAGEVDPREHVRMNQAMKGGPLYCRACFSETKLCERCNTWWHPSEKNHVRKHHEDSGGKVG